MKTLNIIGCGRVGKTLGRLWSEQGVFKIGDVQNQSLESSRSAVEFLQGGRAIESLDQMRRSDLYLISTGDDQILPSCNELVNTGLIEKGNIIFQCSGSLPSTDLKAIVNRHVFTASVHPVKSIADPAAACQSFRGTYCGIEGDELAVDILSSVFEAIGGKIFHIKPEFKTEYHAANVIVCNYLTALLELGTRVYERAGLNQETAMRAMEPLVRETVDNNFRLGSVQALTGPIARGDYDVVKNQLEILRRWSPETADLYQRLGTVALDLSIKQGTADKETIKQLTLLLNSY